MAVKKRISKTINDPSLVQEICNTKWQDLITKSFIMETFGEFNGKRKCNPYDIIKVPKGMFGPDGKKNKNEFVTTVGLLIWNKIFTEGSLFDIFGYINKPCTAKVMSSLNKKLSYEVLEDRVSLEDLKEFHLKQQKMMPFANVISPSFTKNMLLAGSAITKKKKELLAKYKDEIKTGSPVIANKIETELLDYAKELLKDDPGMDMYDSGAKSKFGNNFKNLYVMKGAIKDPDPSKGYKIVTSNLMDGISKEDYTNVARAMSEGPYARGKKTMIGGYWEKLFLRSFQHLKLDDKNKNCGTKRTIEVILTPEMAESMMYSYIVDGSKLVELTSLNLDKYLNKKVKFRFASLCESKNGICETCAGNFFNRLGMKNIGVATPQLASKLKRKSMKAFHNSTIDIHTIDIEKAFNTD